MKENISCPRVLHLTHTEIEYDSRILKEMSALVDAGYVVQGIGIVGDTRLRTQKDKSFKAELASINLKSRSFTFLPRKLRHFFTLVEFYMKLIPMAARRRPDVLHCHDTLVLPLGFVVKLLTGSKLIYDAHELESNKNGQSMFLGRMILLIEKMLWPFVDALIVVSPSIQSWYQKNVGKKKSEVILNSPEFIEVNGHSSGYLREKFNILGDRKVFIYIGVLGPGRGIDLLVEAFQGVSSHLVFLGYGEWLPRLLDLEKKFSNIHVHQPVPHSEVVPIAKSADVGLCLVESVSLSDYYCLPNKLFEYCFAKIPVLASDFPDIREVIQRHHIGLTCEQTVEALKGAILNIENNSPIFHFYEVEILSWDEQANKLKNLYKKVLN